MSQIFHTIFIFFPSCHAYGVVENWHTSWQVYSYFKYKHTLNKNNVVLSLVILYYKIFVCYAGIMLNALIYPLCSNLCWHNRRIHI